MYKARVHVTLRPSILDPQGKAVRQALQNLGHAAVEEVRMGKYVELRIDEADRDAAERHARTACEELLANPVMEDFTIELEETDAAPSSPDAEEVAASA
jgi:phosphoribosylformylglycinamidine synthase